MCGEQAGGGESGLSSPVTGPAATRRRGGTHPIPERAAEASAHGGCGRVKDGFHVKVLKNNRQQVTDSRQLMKQELFIVSVFTEEVTTCPVLGERGEDSRRMN